MKNTNFYDVKKLYENLEIPFEISYFKNLDKEEIKNIIITPDYNKVRGNNNLELIYQFDHDGKLISLYIQEKG